MSLDDAIASLTRYVNTGCPTGSFLQSVLENDLMGAVAWGDESSLANLRAICDHVVWQIPAKSWGSRVKVAAWRAARRQDREATA